MVQRVFHVGDEVEINGFPTDRRLCFYVGTIDRLFQTDADILFRDLKEDCVLRVVSHRVE